jgi:hypothetical protein
MAIRMNIHRISAEDKCCGGHGTAPNGREPQIPGNGVTAEDLRVTGEAPGGFPGNGRRGGFRSGRLPKRRDGSAWQEGYAPNKGGK